MRIPFNKPNLEGREIDNILDAIDRRKLAGDGHYTRACHSLLEQCLDARCVLLTTSCTAALEMAALLYDLQEGDEVILPSFTFVSTATAFCLRGARPVFVDIDERTLNLDTAKLQQALTPKTRAIVPVHYAGVACDMEAINAFANSRDLAVVEDAAQALFSTYRGRALGTLGDVGCFSFHETKTFMSGEGGAIVVNDPAKVARAEVLRTKGTNRAAFDRGEVDRYTWTDIGSSYLPSEMVAAFLYGQLGKRDSIMARRKAIHERYDRMLEPLVERGLIRTPFIPPECTINYHLYYILARDNRTRDALLGHLRQRGICAVFHYVPLHSSPYARERLRIDVELPVTDDIAGRIIRLPFYNTLAAEQQKAVADCITEFYGV